jgi:mono/diheme cytochrome c family protein
MLIGASTNAQDATKPTAGLYSASQARRGETIYQQNCVSCHGIDLGGSEGGPPLAGEGFSGKWEGAKISELFEHIKTTMPQTAPGSLTDQQSADLVAFILSKNKFPEGWTDLPSQPEKLGELIYKASHP